VAVVTDFIDVRANQPDNHRRLHCTKIMHNFFGTNYSLFRLVNAARGRPMTADYLRIAAHMSFHGHAERFRQLAAEYAREAKRIDARAGINPPANPEEWKS
jgi:hypothetical protein